MKQILNWLRLRKLESDLDRELQYHVDRRVTDLIHSGLPEPEARRRAALELGGELGGVTQVREEVRDIWSRDGCEISSTTCAFRHDLFSGARRLPQRQCFPSRVTQRTREIGIRLAMGATRLSALWLVLGDALVMVATGSAIALPCVWALGRLVESQLYDVKPTDPLTILAATLVLCSTALGAALIPACRASAVNPTDALRFE